MDFSVGVSLSSKSTIWLNLYITVNSKGVVLSVGFDRDDIYYSDLLDNFSEVSIIDTDLETIQLRGSITRTYKFNSSDELSIFWAFLSRFYNFKPVMEARPKFLIQKKIDIDAAKPSGSKFRLKSKLKTIEKTGDTYFPFSSTPFIENSVKVTKENIDTYIDTEKTERKTHENLDFTKEAFAMILKLYSHREKAIDDYRVIRSQWVLVSDTQLNQNRKMKVFIEKVEKNLETNEFFTKHSETLKLLAFDVNMTHYAFTFGKDFNEKMFRLISYIIESLFICAVDRNTIIDVLGNKNTFIEAAATCFWIFNALFANIYTEIASPQFPSLDELENYLNAFLPTNAAEVFEITKRLGEDFSQFLQNMFKEVTLVSYENWKNSIAEFIVSGNKKLFVANFIIEVLKFVDKRGPKIKGDNIQKNQIEVFTTAKNVLIRNNYML